MAGSFLLADYRLARLPYGRERRQPGWLDRWDERNRRRQDDFDAYERQKREWYKEDQRWKPPIDVPPPHCRGHLDCNDIGRRRR
jgi:hypothetical protein